MLISVFYALGTFRGLIQCLINHPLMKFYEAFLILDFLLELLYHFEIWQASWQQYGQDVCKIF